MAGLNFNKGRFHRIRSRKPARIFMGNVVPELKAIQEIFLSIYKECDNDADKAIKTFRERYPELSKLLLKMYKQTHK